MPTKIINLQHILAHDKLLKKKETHEKEEQELKANIRSYLQANDCQKLLKELKAANLQKKNHDEHLKKIARQNNANAIKKRQNGARENVLIDDNKANATKSIHTLEKLMKKDAKIDLQNKTNERIRKDLERRQWSDNRLMRRLSSEIKEKNAKLHKMNENIKNVMNGKREYGDMEMQCLKQQKQIDILQQKYDDLYAESQRREVVNRSKYDFDSRTIGHLRDEIKNLESSNEYLEQEHFEKQRLQGEIAALSARKLANDRLLKKMVGKGADQKDLIAKTNAINAQQQRKIQELKEYDEYENRKLREQNEALMQSHRERIVAYSKQIDELRTEDDLKMAAKNKDIEQRDHLLIKQALEIKKLQKEVEFDESKIQRLRDVKAGDESKIDQLMRMEKNDENEIMALKKKNAKERADRNLEIAELTKRLNEKNNEIEQLAKQHKQDLYNADIEKNYNKEQTLEIGRLQENKNWEENEILKLKQGMAQMRIEQNKMLQTRQQENVRLLGELEQSQAAIKALSKQDNVNHEKLAQDSRLITTLRSDIAEKNKKLEQTIKDLENQHLRVMRLEAQHVQEESEIEKLLKIEGDDQEVIRRLRTETNELAQRKNQIFKQNETLLSGLEKKKAVIKSLSAQHKTDLSKNKAENANNERLRADIDRLQRENELVETEMHKLQLQNSELLRTKQQLNDLMTQMEEKDEAKIGGLKHEVADKLVQLKHSEHLIQNENLEIKRLQKLIDEEETEIDKLMDFRKLDKAEIEALKKKNKDLVNKHQVQLHALRKKFTEMEAKDKAARNEIFVDDQIIKERNKKLAKEEKLIHDQAIKQKKLQQEIEFDETEIERLQREKQLELQNIAQLKQQNEYLVSRQNEEFKQHSQEKQSLENKLDQRNNELSARKQNINELLAKLQKREALINDLQEQNAINRNKLLQDGKVIDKLKDDNATKDMNLKVSQHALSEDEQQIKRLINVKANEEIEIRALTKEKQWEADEIKRLQKTLEHDQREILLMRTEINTLKEENDCDHAKIKRLQAEIRKLKVLEQQEESEIVKLKARNKYDEHKMKQLKELEEYDEGEIDKLRMQNKALLTNQAHGANYRQKWKTIEKDLYAE